MCAFLAPEPIPQDLFITVPAQLPEPLAGRAADPLAWRQVLARLTSRSLARIDQHGLQMHRLTQAILRDHLTPAQAAATRASAEAILAASSPGDRRRSRHLARVGAADAAPAGPDPAATTNPTSATNDHDATWYLSVRGDARGLAHDLADRLYQRWRSDLGA